MLFVVFVRVKDTQFFSDIENKCMCETLGRTIERNQNQNECLRHERGAKKENSKVLSNKLK